MRLVVLLIAGATLAAAPGRTAAQHTPLSQEAVPEPSGPSPAEERDARLYTALGLSLVATDFSNLSNAVNLNLLGGVQLPWLSWLSGELEFSFTVAPGNNQGSRTVTVGATPCTVPPSMLDPDGTPDGCGADGAQVAAPGATASQNDLQMTNLGGFLALRTPGPLYAIGRYGFRYITSSIEELHRDQTGPAYTAGAGYRWRAGLSKFELAYTYYSEHLDYLGVAVVYGFGGSPPELR